MISGRTSNLRESGVAYLFLAPAFLFIVVFIAYPLVYSFYLTFTEYDFVYDSAPKWVGIKQYVSIWRDKNFISSLKNTLVFAVFYYAIVMFFSLIIAFIIDELGKGQTFYQLAVYLPIIVPLSLAGVMFVWILDPTFGVFNHILRSLGFEALGNKNWLADYSTALPAIVVITLWKYIGFNVIIFLAGIQSVGRSVIEAARVDGVSFFQEKFLVILPNIKIHLSMASLYSIVQAIKVFEVPYVTTRGGPGTATLTLYLYSWRTAFGYFKMGKAATIAYITAALIIFFSFLSNKFLEEKEE